MLLFRQFVDADLGCASYLVGDPEAGVAVVVDRKTGLPLRARMTAIAHFMRHVYGRFDEAPAVEPPG